MFFASTALAAAGGNNGTVLVNGSDFKNGNDPHISCPITFKWQGFDPAPTKDDYSVTVTGINPTGGTATFTAPTAGNPLTGTFTGPDFTLTGVQVDVTGGTAKKGAYHVNLTVETKSAANTDTKSKTVWLENCVAAPATPSDLTVSGACSKTAAGVIDWTVTNPNSDPVTNLAVASNPAGVTVTNLTGGGGIAGNGTATFNTAAPLPSGTSMGASGTVTGQTVHSTGGTFGSSCTVQGQPETPASVSFTDDCSGTTANFTSADQHTSTFTVTPPLGGAPDTVHGSGSKHYGADAAHTHTGVTDDKGGTFGHDWVDPGNCQAAGQADPAATEANHCKSGINLTLSNMTGTADTTFTVTDPDGNVQHVAVRAGQLKKLTFAVKEDTTGSVTVSAPGLAKKTFTYKKNCATVLGIKHIRKPTHKPVVKGEHVQLPFTGFDTPRALLDGAVVFFIGAVLCILGARRKEEEPLYY